MTTRIFCDFDGTIALGDVTDLLLDLFADPLWHDVEAEWQAGRIGSGACMARQVALMRCGRDALDRALDAVAIDPGFPDFVRFCHAHGFALTVVSDGLDYAIARILTRSGIHGLPIVANTLCFLGDDRYAMVSPYAAPDCLAAAGTCKCAAAQASPDLGAAGRVQRVLIGDGRSDFCAASAVDLVVAKGALLDFCRSQGLAHHAFAGFDEVPRILSAALVPDAAGAALSALP